jgi:hypothetical protein
VTGLLTFRTDVTAVGCALLLVGLACLLCSFLSRRPSARHSEVTADSRPHQVQPESAGSWTTQTTAALRPNELDVVA